MKQIIYTMIVKKGNVLLLVIILISLKIKIMDKLIMNAIRNAQMIIHI